MSYTNAIFYQDYEGGSDTARTDLVPTAYANNGSGAVRVTHTNSNAAYASGVAVFDVAATTGSVYVGGWKVTIIDSTHVDLIGSTFTSNPAAKGTLIPRGGSQKSDAWKTMTSGATSARTASGDTLRVMKSPDPTSLGQTAKWTTKYNGADFTVNIVSSTNASPIVITLSAGSYTTLGAGVGDTINVSGHSTNTKANGLWKVIATNGTTTLSLGHADGSNSTGNGVGGATGNIAKYTHTVVELTTAVTTGIALLGNQGEKTNWTASANVSCAISTSDFKEGAECLTITPASGFTTGLAAYYATGTLDLSTRQQVSFWVKQTGGTVAVAGDYSLRLCTDTVGAVSVHTIAIPALAALNVWVPVTVDFATNLNSAIQSVALYVDTDRGSVTLQFDNIIACKASSSADSLTLTSLISKNTGDEPWLPIQSINGTRVVLEGGAFLRPTNSSPVRGYEGTSETVTTYKRETIKTAMVAASSTVVQSLAVNGVNVEGGWDRTSMTTQDGITFFDGQNGLGAGIQGLLTALGTFNKFGTVRYSVGIEMGCLSSDIIYTAGNATGLIPRTGSTFTKVISWCNTNYGVQWNKGSGINTLSVTIGTLYTISNNTYGNAFGDGAAFTRFNTVSTLISHNNGSGGAIAFGASCFDFYVGSLTARNNGVGIYMQGTSGSGIRFGTVTLTNNGLYAFSLNPSMFGALWVGGGSSTGHTSGTVNITSPSGSTNYPRGPLLICRNFTPNETNKIVAYTSFCDVRIVFENYAGTVGDHRIFTDGFGSSLTTAGVTQQTTTKHGTDNYGWKYNLGAGSNPRSSTYPYEQPVTRFAVAANKLVTVTRWYQRDSTGVTLTLLAKAGQLNGMSTDASASISAAINTWEQLTITFTPTEAGTVEIVERAYSTGGTVNGYSSDTAVTQAA